MTATQPPPPVDYEDESPTRRRVRRILTTIVILLCFALLAYAASRTRRGDEEKDQPSSALANTGPVELLAPSPESSVLSQAQIVIDLTSPYSASLVVNGVQIPDDQVQIRPELNQVIFTPGPGKVIAKLGGGRNCVEADIYRLDGTQEDIPAKRWCFNVT